MNKIIDNKSNVLRICAGNDFSILVQITEYDTETGAWVNYDLSAVSDVHMCLIADNGKRINLPVTVNSNGTASAPIQAAYLQKTTYGVELTWLNENLNRRTYAPCLLQIVTSTAESTSNIAEYDSNDAYHFNIKMEADVAILSIGKISDEYITESELKDELEPYINEDELGTVLENYATISALEDYVTNSSLSTTLNDYATKSSLEDYATKSFLATTLNDYATISSLEDYVTNTSLNSTLEDYATKSFLATTLEDYVTNTSLNSTLDDYVTTSIFSSTLNNYATISSLSDYVTNSVLSSTLVNYASQSDMTSAESDITSLDTRVTTLENNPQVPSNVVTSDDGNEIVCLTQSEYDALEQAQTLDPDVFYYITDATSNYVTNSSLNTTLSNYATKNYVDTAVSQVQPDTSNLVTLNTTQTISGQKTFTSTNSFTNESSFTNSFYNLSTVDIGWELAKSALFARGMHNQAIIGQIFAPNRDATNSTTKLSNEIGVIKFQSVDTTVNGQPSTLTDLARIDSNGIYEGTTLLSDKYALKSEIPTSSGVSEEDLDNSNEAIAYELTNNRVEHMSINDNFNNYYTKTEADSRYATSGWVNSRFVTQADDINRQQAIAAAFASSVQSTSVHNIWTGSQNDYDAITTKDTNTLYIIL